jgi:hypothetical protein
MKTPCTDSKYTAHAILLIAGLLLSTSAIFAADEIWMGRSWAQGQLQALTPP